MTIILYTSYYIILLYYNINVQSKYVWPLDDYCTYVERNIKYLMVPIPAVYKYNTIIVLIIIEKRKWEINSRLYCQSLEFIENFPADLYFALFTLIYCTWLYIYIYMMVLCYNYTFFSDFYHITHCTQYLLLFFTVFPYISSSSSLCIIIKYYINAHRYTSSSHIFPDKT